MNGLNEMGNNGIEIEPLSGFPLRLQKLSTPNTAPCPRE